MEDDINVENMEPDMGVTSDDKLWAALAYVLTPLIPIIILLMEDKKNRPFILGQPAGTAPRIKTFKVVEPALKFKCDVHPWMGAYLFVLDHPYFGVSRPDGSFSVPGLPPGSYTLIAWHERLGTQKKQVEVGTDGAGAVSFTFASK